MSTYRTFIAIEIPPDIRRRIKEPIDQLRAVFPDVRASWTREDNLHLTLKFLSNVPVARIPALSNAGMRATGTLLRNFRVRCRLSSRVQLARTSGNTARS